jgi:hypothetical protein
VLARDRAGVTLAPETSDHKSAPKS